MSFFRFFFHLSLTQYLLLTTLIVAEVFVTAWLYNTIKEKEEQMLFFEFEDQSKEITATIQKEISLNLEKLVSLNALFIIAHPISRENFKSFTHHILTSNTSIQALSWVPKINYQEKSLLEDLAHKEGFLDFAITEKKGPDLVAVSKRSEYFPVYYIEPYLGNEPAFGFDLASNPVRLRALEKAKNTNKMVATARVTLVQETSSEKGVLVIYPFTSEGALVGYLTGVFRIRSLISKAIGNLPSLNCNIVVHDITAEKGNQLLAELYHEKADLDDNNLIPLQTHMQFSQKIEVADREWLIEITPTQYYLTSQSSMFWLILMLCIAICVGLLYHLLQYFNSENLLLNILPAEIAYELKTTGKSDARYFELASILFSDFKDFTKIAAIISPKQLISELDELFSKFDDIMQEEGIEKIQTVGDAYLAASGLPTAVPDHAHRCVRAAKKMINFLNQRNETSAIKWKVRIGIHSGPIAAGIIGKKKFAYNIFGDTINIASRLETSGKEGRINVSAYTYNLIKDQFSCEYRGKINAKGKGDLDMYFVE